MNKHDGCTCKGAKFSEETLVGVCYAVAAVIMCVIGGISFCLTKVLKSLTD